MKSVGVLTGGGDCPGINAVIRGVVLKAARKGTKVVGFRRGYQGLLGNGLTTRLGIEDVEEIHALGGTIIGTSRTNPFKEDGGPDQVRQNLERHECEALIVIGGEKTLGIAHRLHQSGIPIVGVPKTVDNNVSATDYTFGFLTAVNTATDAIDRLAITSRSHGVSLVIQVMGRNAGWLALYSGMATGAHEVLIPEKPFDVDAVAAKVKRRYDEGIESTIIVVAEGAKPSDPGVLDLLDVEPNNHKHTGVAKALAMAITEKTGIETRHTVLGPLQRSGSPTAYDRVLGLRLGVRAAELAEAEQFGMMASVRGNEVVTVPLEEAVKQPKTIDDKFYKETREFFE